MVQVKCASCGFPIATNGAEGDQVSCPSCGASGILAKVGQAVTLPGPLFFGTLGFVFGTVLGPALIKWTEKYRK